MQNTPHPHPFTWVVVADKCKARIYRLVKFPKIEEIFFLEHPESRLRNQDLVTTKQGSSLQRGGTTRYGYQQKTEPRQLEAEKFATFLTNYLTTAERKGEFNRLYLLAEPSFLGLLRKHMSPEIQKTIVAQLAKDVTSSDLATIENLLLEL